MASSGVQSQSNAYLINDSICLFEQFDVLACALMRFAILDTTNTKH